MATIQGQSSDVNASERSLSGETGEGRRRGSREWWVHVPGMPPKATVKVNWGQAAADEVNVYVEMAPGLLVGTYGAQVSH